MWGDRDHSNGHQTLHRLWCTLRLPPDRPWGVKSPCHLNYAIQLIPVLLAVIWPQLSQRCVQPQIQKHFWQGHQWTMCQRRQTHFFEEQHFKTLLKYHGDFQIVFWKQHHAQLEENTIGKKEFIFGRYLLTPQGHQINPEQGLGRVTSPKKLNRSEIVLGHRKSYL